LFVTPQESYPEEKDYATPDECLAASSSQWGQDYFLYANFFNDSSSESIAPALTKRGFYVDVGANHPYKLSNTWFFDKCLGWQGVCIEANRALAPALRRHRSCVVVEECVAESRQELSFTVPVNHEVAFIAENNAAHVLHKMEDIIQGDGILPTETRTCLSLDEILDTYAPEAAESGIDFMDVDIEGYELPGLQGLDFRRYPVRLMSLENSFHDRHYEEPMFAAGYHKVGTVGSDDIWERRPSGGALVRAPRAPAERVAYADLARKNRKCCGAPDKCNTFNP